VPSARIERLDAVSYTAARPEDAEGALLALFQAPALRSLELTPAGFQLTPRLLHLAGLLLARPRAPYIGGHVEMQGALRLSARTASS